MHQRIKLKDVAAYCMMSRTTVRRWIDGGKLQAFRLPSGHYRIRQVDYRQFLENCEIPLKEVTFGSKFETLKVNRFALAKESTVPSSPRNVNTDIFNEGNSLLIISELPGIDEKDIKVEVKGDRLELFARSGGHRYFPNIGLPCAVRENPGLTYKNRILKISLEKETK